MIINGRAASLDRKLRSGDHVVTTEYPLDPEPETAPAPTPEAESIPEMELEAEPAVEPEQVSALEPEAVPEPAEPAALPAVEEPGEKSAPVISEEPVVPVPAPEPERTLRRRLMVYLNGAALILPGKADGSPYYLMDLLDRSGIDFETLDGPVELLVNDGEAAFTQELRDNDRIIIRRV